MQRYGDHICALLKDNTNEESQVTRSQAMPHAFRGRLHSGQTHTWCTTAVVHLMAAFYAGLESRDPDQRRQLLDHMCRSHLVLSQKMLGIGARRRLSFH